MDFPFELPSPPGNTCTPKWDGQNFVFADQCIPVLEYSENFTGWNDDLTALHEEATENHPIDVISRNDAILQIINRKTDKDSVIMEIGCSSGYLIHDLKKIFPKNFIIGTDVVKEPLYKLAKQIPGVPLIRFDLLQCPLPNECIDVIVMLNVLEHIEDDVKALEKAYQLLKPGGIIIIEVPAGPHLYNQYDKELLHFRRYSSKELQQKLEMVKLKLIRRSHLGFIIYPVFALMKLKNKLFPSKTANTVKKLINKSYKNTLVRLAMEIETKYLAKYALPFGIRVLMVGLKI